MKLYATTFLLTGFFLFLGAGCNQQTDTQAPDTSDQQVEQQENQNNQKNSDDTDAENDSTDNVDNSEESQAEEVKEAAVVLPVQEYAKRRTLKTYGEYISDRFQGYHVGDDIEFTDVTEDVPVRAIAGGTVEYASTASGYGGVIIIRHDIEGQVVRAVYGHVDMTNASVGVGDAVEKGQTIAQLGEHETAETDGERKHLHFALYTGDRVELAGYTGSASSLEQWLNPQDFFVQRGIDPEQPSRTYNSAQDRGGDIYKLQFTIPEGWEVEYVPSIESLNLYTVAGSGTALERSQVFIRYFDASQFLTLQTVTIHITTDRSVGTGPYVARAYDIEKKAGVASFADQPSWRNSQHTVTDFRATEGYTRYYVVAANPSLDTKVYEEVLASMKIVE